MSEKRGSRQFYGPAERVWDDFKRICKREGSSASEKLTGYVEQYVLVHRPGNPQTLMPSYSENGSISLENQEGWLRQKCLERAQWKGDIDYKEIIEISKDTGLEVKHRKAMADRTAEWLAKTMMVKVWK